MDYPREGKVQVLLAKSWIAAFDLFTHAHTQNEGHAVCYNVKDKGKEVVQSTT